MSYCGVKGCKNNFKTLPKLAFHKFPTIEEVKVKWLEQLGLDDTCNYVNKFVCSEHFEADDYIIDSYKRGARAGQTYRWLKPTVYPTLRLDVNEPEPAQSFVILPPGELDSETIMTHIQDSIEQKEKEKKKPKAPPKENTTVVHDKGQVVCSHCLHLVRQQNANLQFENKALKLKILELQKEMDELRERYCPET